MLKWFRATFYFLLVLFSCQTAFAFFSPSSFQLLSNALGSFVVQLIVIIAATVGAFFLKHRKIKWFLISGLIIGLVIVLIFVGVRFSNLKNLNVQYTFDELKDVSYDDFNNYVNISFDKQYMEERFVDLNNIDENQYDKYKKVHLLWKSKDFLMKDSITSSFGELWDILRQQDNAVIDNYLKQMGLTKDDKILVLCNGGWASSLISYYLNNAGYDSYYTYLRNIETGGLINSSLIKEINEENSIVIDYLTPNENDESYIVFLFDIDEDVVLCWEKYNFNESLFKSKVIGVPAVEFDNLTSMDFLAQSGLSCEIEISKEFDIKNSKVVCLHPLHCLLTQHYLFSLDLGIKTIYRIETTPRWLN